jgi:hypothetical protein
MSSWAEFEAEQPDFAAEVRSCLQVQKHATLATLRADGSPRISGTEMQFEGEHLTIGSMLDAVKAKDLRRDPRFSLHSPTVEPPADDPSGWPGEAKVSGTVTETSAANADSHAFQLDLQEIVHTRLREGKLEIRSWHPGRGLEVRQRD